MHVALDLGPCVCRYSGDMGQRCEGSAKIMGEKRCFQISKPMTSEASEFEASLLHSNRWLTNTMPIFPDPPLPCSKRTCSQLYSADGEVGVRVKLFVVTVWNQDWLLSLFYPVTD